MPVELPTFDELYEVGKAEIQERNPLLTDFSEGSNLDAVTGGGAALADETIRLLVELFSHQFVDTAAGEDLEALALDRFGLTRNPAAASVGTLTYTRGAASGVLTISAGNVYKATVNGVSVTFAADVDTDLAADEDEVDFTATCTATGPTGNVAIGTVTTIVDAVVGDTGATVTNADRFVGGAVEETDDAFRDRIRRYFGTLRKGTVAALEAAALAVPGVSFAAVDESNAAPADGAYVSVYVGDPDARGNDALSALVDAALEDVRAAGIDVRTTAADRDEISLSMTLYVRAGADTGGIGTAARAAVLAYTDSLPPNTSFYASGAEAAAFGVSPDMRGAKVTTPVAETTAPGASHKAIRVNAEDLAFTFVEV